MHPEHQLWTGPIKCYCNSDELWRISVSILSVWSGALETMPHAAHVAVSVLLDRFGHAVGGQFWHRPGLIRFACQPDCPGVPRFLLGLLPSLAACKFDI